jgi:hypothetical protein
MDETVTQTTNPVPGRLFTTPFLVIGGIVGAIFAIPIGILWAKFVAPGK